MVRTEDRKYASGSFKSLTDLEELSNTLLPGVDILEPLRVYDPAVESTAPFVGKRGVVAITPDGERECIGVTGTQVPAPTAHADLLDAFTREARNRGHDTVSGSVLVDRLGGRFRAEVWVVESDPRLHEPHKVGFTLGNSYLGDEAPWVSGALQTLVCSNGLQVTRQVGQQVADVRTRRTGAMDGLLDVLPDMMAAAWDAMDAYVPRYDAWREAAKTVALPDPRRFLTKDLGLPAATALQVVDLSGFLTERQDTSTNGLPSICQVHDALTQSARDAMGGGNRDEATVALGAKAYDRFQESAAMLREKLPLTAVVEAMAGTPKRAKRA